MSVIGAPSANPMSSLLLAPVGPHSASSSASSYSATPPPKTPPPPPKTGVSHTLRVSPKRLNSAVPPIESADLSYDVMHEVREATATPTALSEFLHDPILVSSLISHRKKPRRGSTATHDREREARSDRSERTDRSKREKESDTASLLTLVLAEEEKQAHHLKALLRSTGDRLEYELRRAEQAETRARAAEALAREAAVRISQSDTARHQAELDAARAREEVKRYQLLTEAAEREQRRADSDSQRSDRARADAEKSAAEAREVARKAQQALREYHAREEGRAEGRRMDMHRRYSDGHDDGYEQGRMDGFEAGQAEGYEAGCEAGKAEGYSSGRTEGMNAGRLVGFEEGRKAGYREGYDEGYEEGRDKERKNALEAFDRFMDSEWNRQSFLTVPSDDRTRKWVEATRQCIESGSRPASLVFDTSAEDIIPQEPISVPPSPPPPAPKATSGVTLTSPPAQVMSPPAITIQPAPPVPQAQPEPKEQRPGMLSRQGSSVSSPAPIPIPVPYWLTRKLHAPLDGGQGRQGTPPVGSTVS